MPITEYGPHDTFVAFLDISGFKEQMKSGIAPTTLNHFYTIGYQILKQQNETQLKVEGIFISDCGILFVRDNTVNNAVVSLSQLLDIIKEINTELLTHDIMTTCSIAFGDFCYKGRLEFEGIEKNEVRGYAYLNAYLDSSNHTPHIEPGQCRIVRDKLPFNISNLNNNITGFIKEKKGDSKHYYYYWMVDNMTDIDKFEKDYTDSYKLKYTGMLIALKHYKSGEMNPPQEDRLL
jgi:hypothetical protein